MDAKGLGGLLDPKGLSALMDPKALSTLMDLKALSTLMAKPDGKDKVRPLRSARKCLPTSNNRPE